MPRRMAWFAPGCGNCSLSNKNGDGITVSMSVASDAETRRWWPRDFRVQHRATFGSELKLELTVTNTGASPFRFEEALHTYHRVGDVRKVRIHGLDGVHYLDNTDSNREKVQKAMSSSIQRLTALT